MRRDLIERVRVLALALLGLRLSVHDVFQALLEILEASVEFEEALAELSDRFVEIVRPTVGEGLGFFDVPHAGFVHRGLLRPGRERGTVRVMSTRWFAVLLMSLFWPVAGACAEEPDRPLSILGELTQPEDISPDDFEVSRPFGTKDTQHIMVGTLLAPDFVGNLDNNIHGQWTYFLIDDLEVGAEVALWSFYQDNSTVGVSTSLVIRHHIYQAPRWSFFGEVGIGVLAATDNVPDDGTNFNLMPRAGVGFTYKLFEDQPTRLIAGVRWHHISNARLAGEERNPARDAPCLYAGVLFDF